jgi:hypothetical protein
MVVPNSIKYDGTINNTEILKQDYYQFISKGRAVGIAEEFIYDASYIKLKELSIGYNFPKSLLENIGINSFKVSLVGRNIAYLYKKTPGTSPEGGYDTSMFSQAFDMGAVPFTRTLGISLELIF